jgi:hypothetical protein
VTLVEQLPPDIEPVTAYPLLANLGFTAKSDLPDRPGPAYLLVAIRRVPTLHHYDPERIEYWATVAGRGSRTELTRESGLPIQGTFSWGLIRIVDRLRISNEYLTFGGRVTADVVDEAVVAVFSSPAPLLRRGGHSQGWDHGAECVGAFFGRVMLAIDYVPGFEARFGAAGPIERYAAFVAETIGRYRGSPILRADHPELWNTLQAEERRLRSTHPSDWAEGVELLRAIEHPGRMTVGLRAGWP